MGSSPHIDNKKKDILVLRRGPTQGLEHTLTAEKMYSINFTVTNKKFCLSLHYNGANSYLFVNGTEIYKFKAKDSEILVGPICLGNISKDWSVDNINKTGFTGYVYDFSVDYRFIAVNDITNIHKYLMKKNNIAWSIRAYLKYTSYKAKYKKYVFIKKVFHIFIKFIRYNSFKLYFNE